MHGHVDTTFITVQRELYTSGLARELGSDAINVWLAIKWHADFNTGVGYPSIRRLMDLTKLASATVQKALMRLEAAHLLKKVGKKGRAQCYLARERLDVTSEQGKCCSIVIDYVPRSLSKWIARIKAALETGEHDPDAFARVEVVPGAGLTWDSKTGELHAAIPVAVTPQAAGPPSDKPLSPLAARVAEIGANAMRGPDNAASGPPRCTNTKTGLTTTHLPRGESWLELSVPATHSNTKRLTSLV
ncbi:helix-turn-helix domain-containing protein [Burkholderia cenocepacia]|uniref:helix-turn-helix domain-containing protein n=1 Tax=Burkholderia cepacia complex TaxID=87882 RepID=UPI000F5DA2C1|nr:helix-turn-helix domain-containing protein [Burkholderia semiarida]MDR8042779.1 helix-turn-helix domain-containing protein [Burkholderia cenocepacia]RQY67439.1 DNA-binding protein [Burkholderia stagnalis]